MKDAILNKKNFALCTLAILLTVVLIGCNKDNETETPAMKIGLVTGVGNLFDKGFNQQAWEAVVEGAQTVGGTAVVKESASAIDIEKNIKYFNDNQFDVIVTLGYDAAEPTLAAATSFPQIRFILLDYSPGNLPSNVSCTVFAVDQAAFPCGFLAAARAYQQNPLAAKVGYVAGPKIPPIDQFTRSFKTGVNYFNSKYGKFVDISGVNAATFTDTILGARLADSLIQKGAEVIFACAGRTGNGALHQVKTRGKTAIGVDNDQFLTIPEVGDILISSCMKDLRTSILSGIQSVKNNQFQGGTTLTATLSEKGVALAPYHDFESHIPDSIKNAVTEIKNLIINGSLPTGWPK